jgi:hypothetical protein
VRQERSRQHALEVSPPVAPRSAAGRMSLGDQSAARWA